MLGYAVTRMSRFIEMNGPPCLLSTGRTASSSSRWPSEQVVTVAAQHSCARKTRTQPSCLCACFTTQTPGDSSSSFFLLCLLPYQWSPSSNQRFYFSHWAGGQDARRRMKRPQAHAGVTPRHPSPSTWPCVLWDTSWHASKSPPTTSSAPLWRQWRWPLSIAEDEEGGGAGAFVACPSLCAGAL